MKYRKKPVVIEAWLFDPSDTGSMRDMLKLAQAHPQIVLAVPFEGGEPSVLITTLEGVMTARIGDYIIQGVQGEFYPCKPDIFHQTYEAVE